MKKVCILLVRITYISQCTFKKTVKFRNSYIHLVATLRMSGARLPRPHVPFMGRTGTDVSLPTRLHR